MQGQQIRLADLSLDQKRELTSFAGIAKHILRLPIYDGHRVCPDYDVRDAACRQLYTVNGAPTWQKDLLDKVDTHDSRTSARTCNGAGKTNVIIPALVIPHMMLFPNSRVVITSGGNRQVKDQIFPALRAHNVKLRDWEFHDLRISAPNGATCIGFSTDEGGKFEGWHGNKEELYALTDAQRHELEQRYQRSLVEFNEALTNSKGPLLIIVDEAKSVRQEIFDAIDRCTCQRLVYLSSCGPAEGEFFASHHSKAASFSTLRVPASECPHADHAKNVTLIAQRGRSDPLVQSKVDANFMSKPGDTIIPRADVDALMVQPPAHKPGDRKFACDFAAGGAENVFGARDGNRIELRACWRERDTMKACAQFILHFREAGLRPEEAHLIHGDNSGLGKPMLDRLAELGWKLTRVENNTAAALSADYVNLSAEAWWNAANDIQKRRWFLPNDPLLAAQLSTRKPIFKGDKLGVESKEDMAKRGVESPDRADVCVELMQPLRGLRVGQWSKDPTALEQFFEERNAPELAGFNAGE